MKKKQTIIITALILLSFIMILIISERNWLRLDLTRERLYTISKVSRNLHQEISDRIHITYFLSDRLRAMHPVPAQIEDMLREYAMFSRGRIRLTVRDPARANLIEEVQQLGLMPQQIQATEQDQTSFITVYSGIVIEYLDRVDVLPFVFSPETLEYDLTSSIRALIQNRPRILGVIVGDNPRRWNEDFRELQFVLASSGFRLRLIQPERDIPDSVIALMVLGGVESFSEAALFQIDRYIQTGGRVLFAAKGLTVTWDRGMRARTLVDSGLLQMLAFYGAEIQREMVLDNSALAMQYEIRLPNNTVQTRSIRNPQWVRILGENSNHSHPVSFRFGGLDVFYASPMILNPPEGIKAEYLFTTTDGAWSMFDPFMILPEVGDIFWERDAEHTRGRKILGASLSGIFPSWFADRDKPIMHGPRELPAMPDEASPARITVISDTDFVSSRFLSLTGGQQNLGFVVRLLDWLANDDDIVLIRDREFRSGRLDKIVNPARRTAAMRTAQTINVFIVPAIVILAGIIFTLTRTAKTKSRTEGESQ